MKRIISILMVLMVVLSMGVTAFASEVNTAGEEGSSLVKLNVVATQFSVTVPMDLPVDVNEAGVVTTASNAKVINNSYGPVEVKNVEINPETGWEIVDFDTNMAAEKVGAQKLGFKINNDVTVGNSFSFTQANFPRLEGANDTDTDELAIVYDASIPAQATAITDTQIATVVFTIGWDE